jgi:tellurite resistance protein
MPTMITLASDFSKVITDYVAGLMNHAFSEAAMAVASAVIWADGRINEAEEARLKAFIAESPLLEPYDPDKLLSVFEHFSEMHRIEVASEPQGGGLEGVEGAVLRVTDHAQRVILLRFGLALAKADTPALNDAEERVICRLSDLLGVPAGQIFHG